MFFEKLLKIVNNHAALKSKTEGTMFLLCTKIGEKSFTKEHVSKTFIIKNDQEITGTATKKRKKKSLYKPN